MGIYVGNCLSSESPKNPWDERVPDFFVETLLFSLGFCFSSSFSLYSVNGCQFMPSRFYFLFFKYVKLKDGVLSFCSIINGDGILKLVKDLVIS